MSAVTGRDNPWQQLLRWGLLAVLTTHRVHATGEQGRLIGRPSLECRCTSEGNVADAPPAGCRLASSFDVRPTRGGERLKTRYFSCNPDALGGGGEGGAWVALPSGRYQLQRRPATWEEARRTCERLDAQLVALTGGREESEALLKAFPNARTVGAATREDHIWLGIRYYPEESNGNKPGFYTVRGQPATGLHWARGEPNRRGKNENCVSVKKDVFLYDSPCSWKLMFFCKRI